MPMLADGPRSPAPFEVHDERFADVLGDEPRLVKVVATDAHEGPVYVTGEDALYFTTVPRRRDPRGAPEVAIKRVALDGERFPVGPERVTVVAQSTAAANGMTLGLDGALLVCEQGTPERPAAITRLDPASGARSTVVDGLDGRPLCSPNDVAVRRDGNVWFTDPGYGHLQGFRPPPVLPDAVYCHDPRSGELAVVSTSFEKPNGIALSPDDRVVYVTDSGANQEEGSFYEHLPHHVVALDLDADGRVTAERVLAVTEPGFPDGLKVDSAGRVYASAFSGVQVFGPDGDKLGEIHLPGAVNFTFGGPGGNVLFITADDAIWAAVLNATGPAHHSNQTAKGA
jgi:gluconolactonase